MDDSGPWRWCSDAFQLLQVPELLLPLASLRSANTHLAFTLHWFLHYEHRANVQSCGARVVQMDPFKDI